MLKEKEELREVLEKNSCLRAYPHLREIVTSNGGWRSPLSFATCRFTRQRIHQKCENGFKKTGIKERKIHFILDESLIIVYNIYYK